MKTGNRNSLKIPKMYSLVVCNGQQEKGIKMDKTIHRKLKIEQPPKITNMLSIKNSSILMISVSENFLVESECFIFTK
jgi:hypothetical protein